MLTRTLAKKYKVQSAQEFNRQDLLKWLDKSFKNFIEDKVKDFNKVTVSYTNDPQHSLIISLRNDNFKKVSTLISNKELKQHGIDTFFISDEGLTLFYNKIPKNADIQFKDQKNIEQAKEENKPSNLQRKP